MEFSKIIKQERDRLAYSQQKLADKLKVTQQTIARWENEGVIPETQTLIKVADLFNLPVDYLLGRTSSPSLSEIDDKTIEDYIRPILLKIAKANPIDDSAFLKQIENASRVELLDMFNSIAHIIKTDNQLLVQTDEIDPMIQDIHDKLISLPQEKRKALLHLIIDNAL